MRKAYSERPSHAASCCVVRSETSHEPLLFADAVVSCVPS